jgi:hypothetical protein
MSRIHFIGGEKGGVGKSVVARVLAQWFVDQSLPFAAVDGEISQGALIRYYRDFTQTADLDALDSADQIVDRALAADRRVLVDLPAQSARMLESWMTGANVIAFAKEMGIGLTFWHVCDGGFASVAYIERAIRTFGRDLEHVVVKNFGRSNDFTQFDESDAKHHLDELSGRVVELPQLDPAAMYRIDKFGLSFWAAIHRAEGDDALRPLERQRVKLWLERCYAQLEAFNGTL